MLLIIVEHWITFYFPLFFFSVLSTLISLLKFVIMVTWHVVWNLSTLLLSQFTNYNQVDSFHKDGEISFMIERYNLLYFQYRLSWLFFSSLLECHSLVGLTRWWHSSPYLFYVLTYGLGNDPNREKRISNSLQLF